MAGLASRGEVRHDLADDAAELVPVPGEARATKTFGASGSASMMKCSSGVFVNMHAFMDSTGPSASGK